MLQVIIKKLDNKEIEKRKIKSWPIWTKEVSRFDWYYDTDEDCLILEGEAVIETLKENYTIKAGDFVTFKEELECVWDVKKPVKKHYDFK